MQDFLLDSAGSRSLRKGFRNDLISNTPKLSINLTALSTAETEHKESDLVPINKVAVSPGDICLCDQFAST